MAPRFERLRDHAGEAGLIRRRTAIAAVGVVVVVLVLAARLLYLQYYHYDHYTTLSENNRIRIQAIAPTRGLIYDRNGIVLARNLPSFRLELVPERVEDLGATLDILRPIVEFSADDVARVRAAWNDGWPFEGVVLRFQLSREEVARVSVLRHRLPGVEIVAGLTRYYPYGSTAAHVIGYVGRIAAGDLKGFKASLYRASTHIGKLGVELAYERLLHGEPGVRRVEANVQGRIVRVLDRQPPVPGQDLTLTIDLGLQRFAERLLGARDGAIVALDPRSGEVLALASAPRFNPNLFVSGISYEAYHALKTSPHNPLYNRAIRGRYPPGSTVKPVIALAGLESGVQQRGETIDCRGYYQLSNGGREYGDWTTHETVDLQAAITQSCDVMFYDLALRLGIDRLAPFLRRFGFGQPTGIDLPGEQAGLVPDPAWKQQTRGKPWYTGETIILGIGQGYLLVTPVQLASMAALIANRGRPVRPHLFLDSSGETPARVAAHEPVVEPVELAHSADWEYVIDGMVGVTETPEGTASVIGWNSPHTIAGKSGTAQVFTVDKGEEYNVEEIPIYLRDHALFIAFAPADAPRIAVAVVVENGGSGSQTAGPMARKVIDAWLAEHPPEKQRAREQQAGEQRAGEGLNG